MSHFGWDMIYHSVSSKMLMHFMPNAGCQPNTTPLLSARGRWGDDRIQQTITNQER